MTKWSVLSLMQPWAQLVVLGEKEYETRSWKTNYRGELYIHSSAKLFQADLELCRQNHFFKKAVPDLSKLKTGFIIGKVDLVDCMAVEELDGRISKKETVFGDYSPGRFAWRLENATMLDKPIETRGALSIWQYEPITPHAIGTRVNYFRKYEKKGEWVEGTVIGYEESGNYKMESFHGSIDREIRHISTELLKEVNHG